MAVIERITEEEIEICECLVTPRCLIECLFHNFDNLASFHERLLGHIRIYQRLMLSSESIIDFEATAKYYGLDDKEKFQLQKKVGDCYNFGGRTTGKTLVFLIFDLIIVIFHALNNWIGFASANLKKILGVLDRVKVIIESHPIIKNFYEKISFTTSGCKIITKNNVLLESVNFKISSKGESNSDWYGKHCDRVMVEEASLETEKVAKARRDAKSENGAVMRCSGMTNFTKTSPAGESFYDPENRKNNQILNLPQYVNPTYTEVDDNKKARKFNGRDSIEYRTFVKAEVVTDAISVIDMERIDVDEKSEIKSFEINKANFEHYKNLLIFERPAHVSNIILTADISDIGITDICIFFEVGDKYYYTYNITLYAQEGDAQKEIFEHIGKELHIDYFAIDSTDAMGREVGRYLRKKFGNNKLLFVGFNEKIIIDYEKDIKGEFIFDENGNKIPKLEWVAIKSVTHLIRLLYTNKIVIPIDYKLENQLCKIQGFRGVDRTKYRCMQEYDHTYQAFQCMSIFLWSLEMGLLGKDEEESDDSGEGFVLI